MNISPIAVALVTLVAVVIIVRGLLGINYDFNVSRRSAQDESGNG